MTTGSPACSGPLPIKCGSAACFRAVQHERPVGTRGRPRDRVDTELPGVLGRALSYLERDQLIVPFGPAARFEVFQPGHGDLDTLRAQQVSEREREELGHPHLAGAVRSEESLDERCRRIGDRAHRRAELARAIGVDVLDRRRPRLLSGPTLLERVREQDELALSLENDERIRREEPGGVIDVREPVRVSEEEKRLHAAENATAEFDRPEATARLTMPCVKDHAG